MSSSISISGGDALLPKRSDVDADGALRTAEIDGVQFRPTRPVSHADGHLTEIARTSWPIISEPVVQVHLTTTLVGRVRAWGLHPLGTDRLFVVSGLVKLVVYDGRIGSSSFGRLAEFIVSEKSPGLLTIAPNLYHGWKNIGTSEALIVNMPSRLYDYVHPDALDLPWDSEDARRLIPYQW